MADLYSTNRLTNPSAEQGTNGWSASQVNIVPGGIDGDKCFQVNKDGYLSQKVEINKQVQEYKVSFYFLPKNIEDSIKIKQSTRVTLNYGDNTKDTLLIPCQTERG